MELITDQLGYKNTSTAYSSKYQLSYKNTSTAHSSKYQLGYKNTSTAYTHQNTINIINQKKLKRLTYGKIVYKLFSHTPIKILIGLKYKTKS